MLQEVKGGSKRFKEVEVGHMTLNVVQGSQRKLQEVRRRSRDVRGGEKEVERPKRKLKKIKECGRK